ncbi:MAG TPA: DUF72 domain-containing protein [Povalibacter sp.]
MPDDISSTTPIRIGTASWTDATLLKSGKFYPRDVKTAEGRLRFYANEFPIVEVDSSYYAMPSVTNAALWAERTPAKFIFNMKMFRLFTHHQTEPKVLPPNVRAMLPQADAQLYYNDLSDELRAEMWRQFELAIEPLRAAGKLGALLFQFPKWFIARRSSIEYLHEIRRRLANYTLAVEFRHESWFSDGQRTSTLALERELEFCNVIVDEPQLPGSVPAVWEVTLQRLAIVRLHGRNAATWNMKGLKAASDRFNYDYSDAELRGFVTPVRRLREMADEVHVIFNNNLEDQGVRNARTMLRLLNE